ncbi:ATP-binding protein [Burkholderia cenocepacia]|uniref:AAA family ATPase n=1 Tax=Burkholderia cenocepacia TaxID=95486 RepID=UPI00158E808A|nr:ATP-binding protein [Burkholderia cenocepacia]MBR7957200.1 ATP-binding protein [Burkholderia cenocepacia]
MLIEFSVANFRSFREKQTFQMTAAPRLGKVDNTFDAGVKGEKLPRLLKAAVIYGANASGKSSLILALGVIEKLAKARPDARRPGLPVSPFRFDKELLDKPSEFEIHFITDGMRYQFQVAATQARITQETLYAYPRGKECLIYDRRHSNNIDEYKFGSTFEADHIVRDVWRNLTGPQSLFISQAVANSNDALRQLKIPFHWLTEGLFLLEHGPSQLYHLGARVPSQPILSKYISAFLQEVDVPVTEIRWERAEDPDQANKINPGKSGPPGEEGKTTLTHETRLGSAEFDLSEESSGTRNLIGFWLPWSILSGKVGETPQKYGLIVVDEFDSSLHPEIVEHLVSQHIASGSKAQLIFTTHDTHLMSTKLLRRDQLWVTDRNSNGATRLTSIHSYKGRESEDIEKRYFEGRYRGLPIRRGK